METRLTVTQGRLYSTEFLRGTTQDRWFDFSICNICQDVGKQRNICLGSQKISQSLEETIFLSPKKPCFFCPQHWDIGSIIPTRAQVSQNHLQNNCCKCFWDTIIGHSRSYLFTRLFTSCNLIRPTQNTAFSCNISRAFSTPRGYVAIFSRVMPSISPILPNIQEAKFFQIASKGFFLKVVTGQKFTVFPSQ